MKLNLTAEEFIALFALLDRYRDIGPVKADTRESRLFNVHGKMEEALLDLVTSAGDKLSATEFARWTQEQQDKLEELTAQNVGLREEMTSLAANDDILVFDEDDEDDVPAKAYPRVKKKSRKRRRNRNRKER